MTDTSNTLQSVIATAVTAAFDFDAALADAEDNFDRKAKILSDQDRICEDLAVQLAQAELARAELQGEYDQAAREDDDLHTYLGVPYEVFYNDSPYQP